MFVDLFLQEVSAIVYPWHLLMLKFHVIGMALEAYRLHQFVCLGTLFVILNLAFFGSVGGRWK